MTDIPRCIVTVEEFIEYLGKPNLDDSQQNDAANRLAGTQSRLELHLNRPVQPVRVRQAIQVDMEGMGYFYVTPVISILEVVYMSGGHAAQVAPAALLSPLEVGEKVDQDWLGSNLDGTGAMIVPGGAYLGYPGWCVVDYVGGYNGFVDAGLKDKIKEVTARGFSPVHNDFVSLNESTASEGVPPDKRDPGWTEDELKSFDRLRRRVAV